MTVIGASSRWRRTARYGRPAAASQIWDARRFPMQAADEREALRRAGMARAGSPCGPRVRYRTADVLRRFVLAQAFVDDLTQQIVLGLVGRPRPLISVAISRAGARAPRE